jgi:heme-degrading monooxygenase HmoA
MIARISRGVTREGDVEAYHAYLAGTGLAEYRSTPGNRGVHVLVKREGDRAEWLLLTLWDSWEAVKRFAGEDIDAAVFYPEDDRFLLERGERVEHFEVVASSGLV